MGPLAQNPTKNQKGNRRTKCPRPLFTVELLRLATFFSYVYSQIYWIYDKRFKANL